MQPKRSASNALLNSPSFTNRLFENVIKKLQRQECSIFFKYVNLTQRIAKATVSKFLNTYKSTKIKIIIMNEGTFGKESWQLSSAR